MKKRLLVFLLAMGLAAAPCFGAALNDKAVTVGGGNSTFPIYNVDDASATDALSLVTKNYVDNLAETGVLSWVSVAQAFIDGVGPALTSTTPALAATGNVYGLIWDDSSETVAAQFSGMLPSNYSSGLTIYVTVRSDAAGAAGVQSVDWRVWVEGDGVAFDAAAIQQAAVVSTNDSLDTSSEVFALVADATLEAAISGGSKLVIDIFNASSSDNDLIITHLDGIYTK